MAVFDTETGEEIFCHPETNERLETQEEAMAALAWIEEQMAPYYRVRRNLRDWATRRWPSPALPAPRNRTPTQEKVARCPRCGGRLESERAPE